MYHVVQSDRNEISDGTTPRDRLLAAAAEHIARHGVSDVTLRGLAAAIGSSHRMLIYHFKSKDNLLVEVIRLVEARQLEVGQ